MKEVRIVSWCDHEGHEINENDPVAQREEATQSFQVSVDGEKPYEIDLCDEHALPFIEVFTVLEERGTMLPATTKKKKQGVKPPGSNKGGRQPENLPNPPCPDCGRGPFRDRSALGSHSREIHGKALIDLLPPEQLGITNRLRLAERATEAEAQAS